MGWGEATPSPPRGLKDGWGLHLAVFTDMIQDGMVPGARPGLLSLSSSPGLEGAGQGPTPTQTFSSQRVGGTWPLAPCGLGLHIHKPRNSLKNGFFKKHAEAETSILRPTDVKS